MTATLVDSNVLIDLIGPGSAWTEWSAEALTLALEEGTVIVNQVVYAEVSVGFGAVEQVDWALDAQGIERMPLPWPAAFAAGRAFVAYRRRGGRKRPPLPDFFIGAHAAVSRLRLLTRDPARYRSYFPAVQLVAPEDPWSPPLG